MDADRMQIVGLGASTSVGRNVWASAAAARAGVCGFAEHPFMIDTAGEPMRVARAPWLDVTHQGVERYSALLVPAIDEALAFVREAQALGETRVALAVGLPPPRPGRPSDLGERLAASLVGRYARAIAKPVMFELGHAAGHVALGAAMRGLNAASIDACVVAGVDSYLTPETLEWVEACDQLHGAGPLNNAWGFIPGEAAGAVLVATQRTAQRLRTDSLGDIVGLGLGREPNPIKTDSVCIGEGLTAAFRQALAGLAPQERVHNVFCDLNGETYRADEYGFTALRTKERFVAATDFIAPAECWGDVGAASAPLHIALAVIAHRKRYGKGPLSMVSASSESGDRGAAVIRAVGPSGD